MRGPLFDSATYRERECECERIFERQESDINGNLVVSFLNGLANVSTAI